MAKSTTNTKPESTKPKTVPPPPIATAKKPAAKSAKTVKKITPVVEEWKAVEVYSRFTDFDISLFQSGKHYKLYEKFGSHVIEHNGVVGTYFAVWAPNAQYVSVIGNFNYWDRGSHPLYIRWDSSGIWEGFIPHVGNGEA